MKSPRGSLEATFKEMSYYSGGFESTCTKVTGYRPLILETVTNYINCELTFSGFQSQIHQGGELYLQQSLVTVTARSPKNNKILKKGGSMPKHYNNSFLPANPIETSVWFHIKQQ